MSSNLAVEESMAADPAKNPGRDELGEGSSAVDTNAPMDIDNAYLSSETIEMESGKEAGGDNEKLEAGEVNADTENSKSGERSTGKEKRASGVEENNTKQASANQDGKEAVVYLRREKHQTIKNTTPSPELQKSETTPGETHITYNLPSVDDRFAVSDLVWGKVKSHPWWPGVIMNPSDGSNLAMKYQKRDTFLVAYFGDKTFAWCNESQLKPFFPNFSHFERQASSDAFPNAVRSVLVEVSRRLEVGLICSCLDDKLFAKEVYPKLENAGVRQGFVNCAVNRDEIVNHFNPKGLVDFIKDLALVPVKATTDKLELVMVTSQIKAFCWSKGYSVPPKYQTFGPLEEYIEPVIVPGKSKKLPENCILQVQAPPAVTPPAVTPSPVELGIVEKPKKKRGRPPKKKKEELDIEVQTPPSELVHKKVHSHLANGSGSNSKPQKTTTDEEDSASLLPWKKRKEAVGFDLVEPENQAQTPRSNRLTGSVSGSSPLISTPEFDSADFDVSSDDETPTPTPNEEKRRRTRRLKKYHYSDPKEVLSQLCLVATGPIKEYGFLGTIVSYFTDLRNFIVEPPPSTEMGLLPEKVKLKEGRKRKVDLTQTRSDEVVTPTDHTQDYWSDMILCGQTEEPSSWPKQHKRRVSIETKHLKLSPVGPDAKRALAVAEVATKRPIIRLEEKRLDECNPTAVLLSFGTRYGTAPSEMDLVRIFSRYGPLKEWEMGKVEGTANRVWIVFKRRADAEMAFGSLRKQNVFGPSLLSYRLVYEVPEKCEQEKEVEVLNVEENKNVDLPEPEESVNLPSVEPGDYVGKIAVDLSNNVEGVGADIMLVDPSSNVEGDDVEDIVVDPSSNVGSVGAEVLSVDPSSNVESVDVAQGDGVDEIPVDPSGNVATGQEDALLEMLIEPLGTGENEESGAKKSDGSKTGNEGMAVKSSMFAKPSSKSNGSTLLECTSSRSAIRSCDTRPPFRKSSPIWRPLESLELFTRTPQQPHFKKLESYCQEMRDGMAIGLMVTYANLVESIKKLSIDDVAVFEQKFDCLKTLDENGFNVDRIRTRLSQLLQIKTDHAGSGLKQAELEKELAKKEIDSMNMVGLIEKIKSDVAKLDEQINALSEQSRTLVVKRDQLLELTVGNGHEISRLKNELSYVNKSQGLAREEFARVLAEPFGGGTRS